MLSMLRRSLPQDLLVRERPDILADTAPLDPTPRDVGMDEYATLTKTLGISNPHVSADLGIERFKAFLRKKDWAVFSLPTVIAYMNDKAAAESDAKAGWHWRPLRDKDNIKNARFGTPARAWGHGPLERQPASDHYKGPHSERQQVWSNSRQNHEEKMVDINASATPYDKLVPIHALRKVVTIEGEFAGKAPGNPPIAFFVCDYAPAPHIEHPDPFLMAVIDNARLSEGVGRFVIDFWDEPGFGLDKQLA